MVENFDYELSMAEKLVLSALSEGAQSPEDILKRTGLKEMVEVMNAASWLKSKGLVEIEERVRRYYSLAKKQYAHKDLPERRALKVLKKRGGAITLKELKKSRKLTERELSIAIGWMKKKHWAEISREGGETILKMTERGSRAALEKGKDEDLLTMLGRGEMSEDEVDMDAVKSLLSRQELIREREVVQRSIKLTPAGRELVQSGIEIKEEISQLTPQMLQTGRWREYSLRRYDVRAFAPAAFGGRVHPLNEIAEEVREAFLEMGFKEIKGDFVESCFWTMDVLFVPQDHPARDLQDTFYIKDVKFKIDPKLAEIIKEVHENGYNTGSRGWGYTWKLSEAEKAILRTHTTVNTIRYLAEHPQENTKVFSIGRVFRRDAIDATHLPEFYQIEGIVAEENANFAMLIGVLMEFYRRLGFEDVRVRPAYFPYTEPSMEIEVKFGDSWLEMGGSGIFRPEVTEPLGIKHPVLAWGLGLERLAILKLGLDDLRKLYISDIEWLRRGGARAFP